MRWICAEVPACPPHGSDQASLFRAFVCCECIVFGRELTLYGSANEVGLTGSSAKSSSPQPLAQCGREPYGNAIVLHLAV